MSERKCGNCFFGFEKFYELGNGNRHVEIDCNFRLNKRVLHDPPGCKDWQSKDPVAEVQPKLEHNKRSVGSTKI